MRVRNWGVRQVVGASLAVAAAALGGLAPGALASAPLAGATRVGAAPAARQISLVLPLKVNDAGLQRLATAVSTPGSAQYGQYESIANLANRFGASPANRARVLNYLRGAGATAVKIDATGLFADATMSVSLAQRLFETDLATFRTGRAASFIAPTGTARVPAALSGAVTAVVGLDTEPLFPQAHSGSPPAHTAASGYVPRSGTPSGCTAAQLEPGFTPNQYLTAYNYAPLQAAGITGQGERVALIEIDGFKYSDLRAFANCFSLATPAINGYAVGLKHALAPGGETTLDLEVLDAAAPNLKAVDVYETSSSATDVLKALTAPLQNPGSKPDVISASLGACELITLNSVGSRGINSAEDSLAIADASGISILAASGDAGSSACVGRSGEPLSALAVSFPASSPLVTGVGGTNVTLNTANQITAQDVWNDAPVSVAAAGGGVSALFRRPPYQNGFVTRDRRIVPDVSMLADPAPGYDIFCTAKGECINKDNSNPWIPFGGTSAASPLFAGGIALVDESLRLHQRQDVGLANPLLYQIDHSPEAASVFSDVVTGSNDLGSSLTGKSLGCCTAGPGFDYASGLGSVNLAALSFVASTIVPKIVQVSLSLPGQKPVQRGHLTAKVSCSGRCLLAAYATLALGRSKPFEVVSDVALVKKRGGRTLELKFSRSQLRRLHGALSHRENVTATVFGVILDPGGNIERATRGKKLRIKH